MPAAYDTWTVHPHGPIEKLAENLWRVEGSLPNMPLRRVMTLARTTAGDLVVHNGIAVDEATLAEIVAWGRPSTLVVPNGYHRLDAKAWKTRFPDLRVVCPEGAAGPVGQAVVVDATYGDMAFGAEIRLRALRGTRDREGVMTVKSADGTTIVLNDVLFNMPHLPGAQGFVLRHITGSSGGPRISRVSRLFLLADKFQAREELEQLAKTPDLVRIVVSHHETITSSPAQVLRDVAATL